MGCVDCDARNDCDPASLLRSYAVTTDINEMIVMIVTCMFNDFSLTWQYDSALDTRALILRALIFVRLQYYKYQTHTRRYTLRASSH